jgi:gentisate 1,2-dioxygenase
MLAGKQNAARAARHLPNRAAALESLYNDISAKNMFPFWATSTDVAHDEIKQLMGTQKAVPHLWSYKGDIEPILFRAAELVTMDDSERRSLILVNPGLSPRRATVSTMYTAYRLNDANEVMPPHRHSPNAIRFGLTGKGNFTGVGGEDITFGPGDMVLTPVDTWHNHGNVGNEPAVNLSVLDLPLVETQSISSTTTPSWSTASRSRKRSRPPPCRPTIPRAPTTTAASGRASSSITAAPASPRRCTCTAGSRCRN